MKLSRRNLLGVVAAGLVNSKSEAATRVLFPLVGASNRSLPKFLAAIARANAGGEPVRIMVSGHSFVSGSGSGSSDAGNHYANGCSGSAWSALLARRLTQLGLQVTWNSWCGDQNSRAVPLTLAQIDQRVLLGAGWVADTNGSMMGDNALTQPAGSVGFHDFTPGFPISRVNIYSISNSGSSEAEGVYADGVLIGTIDASHGNSWLKSSFTGLNATKISLKNNGASNACYNNLVECFPANTTCVLMQNGWMGALASNFIATGNPWIILPAQATLAPDLLIIDTMFNDINGSIPASTWQTQTAALIAAVPSADVIIIGDPLGFGQSAATNDPYYNAATTLRPASCVIDMRTTLGSTYAASNAAGYVSPDSTHPSASGHARMAAYAASRIMTAAGLTATTIPSWVLGGAFPNDASYDPDFANGRYYGDTLANLLSCSRASQKTDLLPSSASGYAYNTFANNVLSITPTLGLLIEEARMNIFATPLAPATQTITLSATGSYTLWVNGSGSAAIVGGTAVITGAGTAINGSKVTINCTVTGTVVVTIAGSLNTCQLEAGAFGTSFTTGARAADIVPVIGGFAALLAKWQGSLLFSMAALPVTSFPTFLGNGGGAQLFGTSNVVTLRATDTSNANAMTATLGSGNTNSPFKAMLSWDNADRSLVGNGGTVVANAHSLIAAPMASPTIGSTGGNFFINTYVARLTMWDYRQYDPTSQSLAT